MLIYAYANIRDVIKKYQDWCCKNKQLQHINSAFNLLLNSHTLSNIVSVNRAHLKLLFFNIASSYFVAFPGIFTTSWNLVPFKLYLIVLKWKRHRERRDLGNMMVVQPGKHSSWPKLATQAMINDDVVRWQHFLPNSAINDRSKWEHYKLVSMQHQAQSVQFKLLHSLAPLP